MQTCTMTIYTEAKINWKMARNSPECTCRELIIHELYAELNSACKSCIIRTGPGHSKPGLASQSRAGPSRAEWGARVGLCWAGPGQTGRALLYRAKQAGPG
jgi:hypothetical protein